MTEQTNQIVSAVQSLGTTLGGLQNSTKELAAALPQFNNAAMKLAESLASVNIPTSIKVETRNQVEVVINGASVLAAIKGDLAREVTDQVISTLQTQVTQIISNMPMRG
jgi:hypothetical protein